MLTFDELNALKKQAVANHNWDEAARWRDEIEEHYPNELILDKINDLTKRIEKDAKKIDEYKASLNNNNLKQNNYD